MLYFSLVSLLSEQLVVVKGGGDLGAGVAWRLFRSGFPVVVTELAQPLVVRRTVAFASAVYEGAITVEGVTAERSDGIAAARRLITGGRVPVLVDPSGSARAELRPRILVDAILAKRNTGTLKGDANLVIALGPGFTPGTDCDAVVETNRGHNLGRVYWNSPAEPNTGVPGEIGGKGAERVLRAPKDGTLIGVAHIADRVTTGQLIARVDGAAIIAPFDGVLRGLVHDGLLVHAGMKIGDVDPRARPEHCFTISDKALAVGGGVLQAVLEWLQRQAGKEGNFHENMP